MYKKLTTRFLCLLIVLALIFSCGGISIVNAMNTDDSTTEQVEETESETSSEAQSTQIDAKQDAVLETTSKEQDTLIDNNTMDYFKKHINADYANPSKMELVNMMLAKQTYADKNYCKENETIDSMWTEDSLHKYITMISNYVAVYNVDDDSNYYVASIDTMHKDSESKVTDVCFAKNNMNGEVVDGCIYDNKTGLAYIPKKLYFNKDKTKYVLDDIQVQLLQLINPNELESTVDVVTESDDKVTANESTVDFFDDTVTLQTQKDMNAKNLVVAVNGIPADEDRFEYDKTTGEITFDNYSAAAMQTVSVKETTPTVLESLSDSVSDLFAMKVKAADLKMDDMNALSNKKYLKPTWLKKGTLFTGGGYVHYHSGAACKTNDKKKVNKNSYYVAGGDASGGTLDLFYRYVIGKNNSLADSVIDGNITDSTKYNTFYAGLYTVNKDYIYKDYQGSSDSHCTWKTSDANTDFSSNDFWKQFGEMYVNMKCAHLSVAADETKPTTGVTYGYIPATMYIRILKVDTADKYVVFGMTSKTIASQEGTGLYKFYYKEQSSVRVKKVYASTADRDNAKKVNGTTLKGAQYAFYKTKTNAKSDKSRLKTVTTGAENSSYTAYTPYVTNKDLKVDVGATVYVKEVKAPTGLALDETIHEIKLKALDDISQGLEVTSKEESEYYSIIKIIKKDDTTVLTDALFTLYQGYKTSSNSDTVTWSPCGIFAYNSTAKAYLLYKRTDTNEYDKKVLLGELPQLPSSSTKTYTNKYAIRETKKPGNKTINGVEVAYTGDMTLTAIGSTKFSKKVKYGQYLTFKDNRNGTISFTTGGVTKTFNAKKKSSDTDVSLAFNIDNNGNNTSEPFYFNVRKSSSDMPVTTSNKGKSRFNVNYGTTASTSADGAVFGLYHMAKNSSEDDPRYTLKYVLFQDTTDGKTYWRWYKYVHTTKDGLYRDKNTDAVIATGYRKNQTPIDSTVGFTEPADTSTWKYSDYAGQWAIRELTAATGYTKQMNWIFGKKSGSTSAVEIPVSASTDDHPSPYVEILNNEDGTINFDPDGIDVTLNAKVGKMADAAVLYGYDYSDFNLPIKKVNMANGQVMEGVEFRLYRLIKDESGTSVWDEEYLQSVKTDANGVATFEGLQFYGTGNIDMDDDKAYDNYYQVRECIPDGYMGEGRVRKVFNFKVVGNKQIQIMNYEKTSKYSPWTAPSGQTSEVQTEVMNLSTNKVMVTNPKSNTTINVGTTPIVTIPNLANIGLKLTKIDKDSAEPIPGVFFTIHKETRDSSGKAVWEDAAYAIGESDADGEVRFAGFAFTDGIAANGNANNNFYQVRETIPEGYPNAGTDVKVFNFQIRPDNTIRISSYQTGDPNVKGSSIFGWNDQGKFSLSVEDTDNLGSSNPNTNTYVSSIYSDPMSVVVPNSKGGYMYIKKQSANTSLNNNNSCYSLEGAKYGLYLSYDDAVADTNRVKLTKSDNTETDTFVTKADGTSEKVKVPLATYFVRELQASKGFSLDGTQEEPVKVEVTANNTEDNPAVYTSNEPPLNDPFNLKLQKLDKVTGKPVAQGSASLEGAIFEIKYFDNTDEKVDGTAKKVWYFKTDKNGEFNATDTKSLFNSEKYKSSDLYIDVDTGKATYPLGTYQIKEVQAPEKYQLSGNMKFSDKDEIVDVTKGLKLVIAQDANGKAYYKTGDVPINADNLMLDVYEKVYEGDIKTVKLDTDGKTPLEGVEFKLVGDDGAEYTGTTDEEGKLSFEKLVPQHYVLTETKTLPGHQLLKDSIDITVPIELTTDEAKKQNVDTSKAVWDENTQTWCFYSQTCEISNDVEFSLPMTGGSSIPYIPMIIALTLIGGGVIALRLRKAN